MTRVLILMLISVVAFGQKKVTTVNVTNKHFVISPVLFLVIMILTIPLLGIGIHLMVQGYRLETRSYFEDLKEIEKKLEEITAGDMKMKT